FSTSLSLCHAACGLLCRRVRSIVTAGRKALVNRIRTATVAALLATFVGLQAVPTFADDDAQRRNRRDRYEDRRERREDRRERREDRRERRDDRRERYRYEARRDYWDAARYYR